MMGSKNATVSLSPQDSTDYPFTSVGRVICTAQSSGYQSETRGECSQQLQDRENQDKVVLTMTPLSLMALLYQIP